MKTYLLLFSIFSLLLSACLSSDQRLLIQAVDKGDLSATKSLLDKGVSIETSDIFSATRQPTQADQHGVKEKDRLDDLSGASILVRAANRGYTQLAYYLIKRGAKLSAKCNKNMANALMHAIMYDHYDTCKMLIQNGINLNTKDKDGYRAIHYAAHYGREDICKMLLSYGVDLKQRDNWGNTPIQVAIGEGYLNIVKLLAQHGGKPLDSDYQDFSTLMLAAQYGHVNVLRYLIIECRANVNFANKNNLNALSIANSHHQRSAAALLKSYGAKMPEKSHFTRAVEEVTELYNKSRCTRCLGGGRGLNGHHTCGRCNGSGLDPEYMYGN